MKFEDIPIYSFFRFSLLQHRGCLTKYSNVFQKINNSFTKCNTIAIIHDMFPFADGSCERPADYVHEMCFPKKSQLKLKRVKEEMI